MARQPAQIASIARDTGDRVVAPTTNSAIQLADALGSVAPEAREFAQRYAQEEEAKASAQARTDALRTSGAAFADAVQQGLIEKTQNPWYMSAYSRESAQVRASNQMAALQEQSQTWDERTDSALFTDRLNREIGELGQAYEGPEEQQGFLTAANQTVQQLTSANTARNVARINQERDANAGTLAATALTEVNLANGGNATPEQLAEVLAPMREEYLGTGGSLLDWEKIVVASFKAAAMRAGDTDILEALKSDALGNLYNRPDVAGDIESDQYRIRQGVVDRLQFAEQQRRAQSDAEAAEIRPLAIEKYGEAIITGDFDPLEFTRWAAAQGYSYDGIAAAISSMNREVQQTQSLQAARFRVNALDPTQGQQTIALFTRAAREPLTPSLEQDITEAYLNGDIDQGDATRLINQAHVNGEQAEREARSGSGGGGGSRQGTATAVQPSGRVIVRNITGLNQRIEALSALAYTRTAALRGGTGGLEQTDVKALVRNAALAHLGMHPGDIQGAHDAAALETARWIRSRIAAQSARPPQGRQQPSSGGNRTQPSNPRRSQ